MLPVMEAGGKPSPAGHNPWRLGPI